MKMETQAQIVDVPSLVPILFYILIIIIISFPGHSPHISEDLNSALYEMFPRNTY